MKTPRAYQLAISLQLDPENRYLDACPAPQELIQEVSQNQALKTNPMYWHQRWNPGQQLIQKHHSESVAK